MKLFDHYFRKIITPLVLDSLQDNIDVAIRRILTERGVRGISSGAAHTLLPGVGFTLSVNSGGAGNFTGFDGDGERVALDLNPKVTPDLSGSFTLPAGGNERWITLMIDFTRVLSQPEVERVGPVFNTVNFVKDEGFTFEVIEGVEAAAGLAVKPSIAGDSRLYVGDILLANGIVDFTGSTIETNRKLVEGLAEAIGRGLDGNLEKLALTTDLAAVGGNFLGAVAAGGFFATGNMIVTAIPAGTKMIWISGKIGNTSVPGVYDNSDGLAVIDDINGLIYGGYASATSAGGPQAAALNGVAPAGQAVCGFVGPLIVVGAYAQGASITISRPADVARGSYALVVFIG